MARLLELFKIRNVLSEATGVHRLALVRILDPITGGRFHLASGHSEAASGPLVQTCK